MILNWKVSPDEAETISLIAHRAADAGLYESVASAMMDVTAVHKNGNPLDLNGLAQADNLNFSHDLAGIRSHLDRNTGELLDFFSPRFSA